jgi:hypothetical protein
MIGTAEAVPFQNGEDRGAGAPWLLRAARFWKGNAVLVQNAARFRKENAGRFDAAEHSRVW